MAWTNEETKKLIEVYPYNSMKDLLKIFPNKNKSQIKSKATYLKLKKVEGHVPSYDKAWEDEELKILREFYPKSFIEDLCKMLPNKTKEQIRSRVAYEGLTKNEEILKETINKWNDDEKKILKLYYEVTPMEELIKMLPNKTERQILTKARHMKLKKDEEFVNDYRVEKMLGGRSNIWSNEEIAVLHKYYKNEGVDGCKKHLPNRTLSQIYAKAIQEGLKTNKVMEEWERTEEYHNPENLKQYTFIYEKRKGWRE